MDVGYPTMIMLCLQRNISGFNPSGLFAWAVELLGVSRALQSLLLPLLDNRLSFHEAYASCVVYFQLRTLSPRRDRTMNRKSQSIGLCSSTAEIDIGCAILSLYSAAAPYVFRRVRHVQQIVFQMCQCHRTTAYHVSWQDTLLPDKKHSHETLHSEHHSTGQNTVLDRRHGQNQLEINPNTRFVGRHYADSQVCTKQSCQALHHNEEFFLVGATFRRALAFATCNAMQQARGQSRQA
mmetsp:Transcript_17397/g.42618  ORF Transcript_17397/g.42618 Transcript_17397/m.42618 type:complete len:237 (-) Transcript_17397:3705-4415(-)